MMSSEHVIDVSEEDFQQQVLLYSKETPVVVDFWAEWCGPCRMLGPILEKLAHEAQGAFRLAKLNVDENPNLSRQFNVQGIPIVKAFRNGQVVAEFTGALPEPRVREFLEKLAPSPSSLNINKGNSLLESGDWVEAADVFQEELEGNPDHPAALLGMAKSMLARGLSNEALVILRSFPTSKQYIAAEKLIPLANALVQRSNGEVDLMEGNPLAAAYNHSLRLVEMGNIPASIDGMLGVLREDKHYLNARIEILSLLELLGEGNPLTREYRTELASILF
jgi:putative thioredoxin